MTAAILKATATFVPVNVRRRGEPMRVLKYVLVLILACALSAAQHPAPPGASSPATLVSGLGDLHHPVSAGNAQAQQFFDQGLRYIYAFNHDEAARSFQRAAELD